MIPIRSRRSHVAGSLVAVGALALIAVAGPASAHVTVAAQGAAPGASDVTIMFRVPNEDPSSATVALSVSLPTDTPIATVDVLNTPGWKATVTSVKLTTPIKTDDGPVTEAVSRIDWKVTTDSAGIAAGQFGEFAILCGQLPDTSSLTFPAIQTYADGKKVSWTQVAAPGSNAEPDFPAPALDLTAASASASASLSAPTVTAHAAGSSSSGSSSTTALVMAILALALGAAALAIAVLNRRRPVRT